MSQSLMITCTAAAEFIQEKQVGVLQNKTVASNYITRRDNETMRAY